MHLLVKKYEEAISNPFKLKANREFLMLQKILLRDARGNNKGQDVQRLCPLTTWHSTKRIEVYDDELAYLGKDGHISGVQMSSEPHRNFFLAVINSVIYKYDLVSKELLFSFRAKASREMILYDGDDKLCVASDDVIRLWDFYDKKEQPPEMWSSHEFQNETIQRVFLNEGSKGTFVFVVVTDCKCYIFEERLEVRCEVNIGAQYGTITVAAFNADSTQAYFGTSNGFIACWDMKDNEFYGTPFQITKDSLPITAISRFQLPGTIFLVTVNSQDCYVYTVSGGEGLVKKTKDKKKVEFNLKEELN